MGARYRFGVAFCASLARLGRPAATCALILTAVMSLEAAAAAPAAPVLPPEWAEQRMQFVEARRLAERGPDGAWREAARGLEAYPLYPYLEYFELRRTLDTVKTERIVDFLDRHPGLAVSAGLRQAWTARLLGEQRWAEALAMDLGDGNAALRCGLARAALELGDQQAAKARGLALWRVGRSQPEACDPVFDWLREARIVGTHELLERHRLAVDAGEFRLAAWLERQLPSREREPAERRRRMAEDPRAQLLAAKSWPASAEHAALVAGGLQALAARDSLAAAELWAVLADRQPFTPAQALAIEQALALFLAARFDPRAAARIDAIAADARKPALREWRVRVALHAGDWADALVALDQLEASQREQPRWRWIRARALEALDQPEAAQSVLRDLAEEANYWGFLAADRLGQPYRICPLPLVEDPGLQRRLLGMPGLARAIELHALGELAWARREWDAVFAELDVPARHQAALLAGAQGWHDRGIHVFSAGEGLRAYAQRFPLAWLTLLEPETRRHGLELPWVKALIRAESAWTPDARSVADARGLMQVLPATASEVARRHRLVFDGPGSLFRPEVNLPIGHAYLAELAERHQGNLVLMAAAYNAGQGRVRRWLEAGGPADADLWIETLSFRETREYVSRVLAFSVLYDWRLNGDARRLSSRMPPIGTAGSADGPRTAVVCDRAEEGG